MNHTINLTVEEEEKLSRLRERLGVDDETALRALLESADDIPPLDFFNAQRLIRDAADPEAARAALQAEQSRLTKEMFAKWREEDAAMSPDEIAQAEAEWRDFVRNIDAVRAENGEKRIFG